MYGRGRRVLDDMPSFILETNLILFYYYQYVNESRIARQGIKMRKKTTKELLADSFLELAEKIPINKITIANKRSR